MTAAMTKKLITGGNNRLKRLLPSDFSSPSPSSFTTEVEGGVVSVAFSGSDSDAAALSSSVLGGDGDGEGEAATGVGVGVGSSAKVKVDWARMSAVRAKRRKNEKRMVGGVLDGGRVGRGREGRGMVVAL